MGRELDKLLVRLQLIMALLLHVNFVVCIPEERAIYLVLMEGDPVAFHRGSSFHEDARTLHESNRFRSNTCFLVKMVLYIKLSIISGLEILV